MSSSSLSSNNAAAQKVVLKKLEDYSGESWYSVANKILDCSNLITPLSINEFEELKKAYLVAAKENDNAKDSEKPCDSRWSYIIGFMLYKYGSNSDIKREAKTYFEDAITDKNNQKTLAAASYFLGRIYKDDGNLVNAKKFFDDSYNNGCFHTENTKSGGRRALRKRTHRKKRELRKRTLRKNRTKRRA